LPLWCDDCLFVAGTIFWCRPDLFKRLRVGRIRMDEFHEGYQPDKTLAHALERVFGLLAETEGRHIVGV
jgi:lipopolysaccharide biosynthesis protein